MRVVIAEDDALLREGLSLLLKTAGIEVAAAVDNADDFLAAVAADRPDAVVVDVRLPPTFTDDGLRAAVRARAIHPGLPVLVLSAYVEDSYASELLGDGAGGIGYLLKERVGKVDRFLESLRRVAEGGTAMDPEVISQLLVRRRADDPLSALTAREREVLALMAEGHANPAIAERLVVTEGAVHKHIRNIFAKLGLSADEAGHRRVLAVLAYLDARPGSS
ncbi:response regulator [Nocardia xishanensis]|uniref:response regulator n=1 Tax=Nocardia xishanensis TaxID=238964 RepID=UPI00082E7119|nr:response regulator transcription factor [Nocardia xishanensis]